MAGASTQLLLTICEVKLLGGLEIERQGWVNVIASLWVLAC